VLGVLYSLQLIFVNIRQALRTFDQVGSLHWLALLHVALWPFLCVYRT